MMEGDEYIQASKEKNVESSFNYLEPLPNPRKKKKKAGNKRRFSDEQIRSLECIFESESKLEPRKQMQVATDLGLQPRQVAIWFQNRRARWKSKRTEQEYRKLRDEYDNLTSQFESLKKEKESLQLELEKLSDLKETGHEALHSDDPNEKSTPRNENFEDRGHQLLRMDEHVEVQLPSLEKWYSVDPSGLLDQSCNSSQWLDFWT